ncbi:MAG: G/U mismatch-specific DNA glycosylase [Phycisphaerales bacterium]|nr:G/U mismatch-specific DNA glycosylase [Phycisphaerales bacterium]
MKRSLILTRSEAPRRPTREQLAAAHGCGVRDVIDKNLRLLFVGINPGLYTAAIGHHFGRPGNRFWPALHAGGFTPRVFSPFDSRLLIDAGLGITNIVNYATAKADELSRDQLRAGAKRLEQKVRRYQPAWVAVLGLTSYRTAFDRPRATLGLQTERIGGARLWLLPNPSGLNAHHQAGDLAKMFRELREAVESKATGIRSNAQRAN